MAEFTIVIDDRQVKEKLGKLHDGVTDLKPLWKILLKDIIEKIDRQFTSEGKEFNNRWKELSSRTISEKIRLGLNNGILQRTGQLRKSFEEKEKTKTRLVIGSKLEDRYMPYHQLGTRRIPERAMFRDESKFRGEIENTTQKYFKDLIA